MDREKLIEIESLVEDVNPSPMVKKLQNDNKNLKKQIESLKLEIGESEARLEQIKNEFKSIQIKKPAIHSSRLKKKRVSSPLSAVMVLGDWHIGEIVEGDEIENFNKFNWALAQKRAYYLHKQFVDWVNVQRVSSVIDELVVICIGDNISGDIHYELQVTNEFPAPVQAVRAGLLMAKTIAEMSAHFNKVRVEFVTLDNHSRLTQRSQWKEGGYNSYNFIVGFVAKERLSSVSHINFNLYPNSKSLVDIKGWKYLCMHGHNIKGWSGIPWYGTDRQVAKEAKARRNMPGKNFDKIVMGHFHTPVWTNDYIVNGSLSGTNEFDHGQGRHADPAQVAFLVHPKYGEMNRIEFTVCIGDKEDFNNKEIVLEQKT